LLRFKNWLQITKESQVLLEEKEEEIEKKWDE